MFKYARVVRAGNMISVLFLSDGTYSPATTPRIRIRQTTFACPGALPMVQVTASMCPVRRYDTHADGSAL